MIIYGTKAVHLNSDQPATAVCPSCETQGSTIFSVFRKHVHIFWIPLFPVGKVSQTTCEHCKATYVDKEFPESFRREMDVVKSTSKGPIWQFAGLAIIALLVVYGQYASEQDTKKELAYIAAPASGDVYRYKVGKGSFSTLKVVSVTDDSLEISENMYEINKLSKIHKIDKPENYSETTYFIARTTIKDMYDGDEIKDVRRD